MLFGIWWTYILSIRDLRGSYGPALEDGGEGARGQASDLPPSTHTPTLILVEHTILPLGVWGIPGCTPRVGGGKGHIAFWSQRHATALPLKSEGHDPTLRV